MAGSIDELIGRPQPIGVYPLPVGYLLLPPTTDPAAKAAVMRGVPPDPWPAEWQFFAAALAGDITRSVEMLPAGPLGEYNRLVLDPTPDQFHRACSTPLRTLAEVVGYALGFTHQPPPVDGIDGELLAHVLVAHAAAALSANDTTAAERCLSAGVAASRDTSPLLAAQLLGQLAAMSAEQSERCHEAISIYQDAIQLAMDTPLVRLRAGLWLSLGTTYQLCANGCRHLVLEAVKAYQEAIACGLTLHSHPDLYAEAQYNLGLAYMSLTSVAASDQLRMGVAVQSFREALKVFTKDRDPERWASATLNLANVLQYIPSAHPAQNLMQAVDLYTEVMTVRNRAVNPVGYARVLVNQANALAHLGQFAPAVEKLGEAYKLFLWYEQSEEAASAMQLVDQIAAARERAAERMEV